MSMEKEDEIEETKAKETKEESKTISKVVNVFLGLSIVLCVVIVFQVIVYGYVSFFGYSSFRIVSGSMEPTICVGSISISKQVDISSVEVDDVIVFTSKEASMYGEFITHRVIEIMTEGEEIYLKTQGDANSVADAYYVDSENFFGEVVYYTGENNLATIIFEILTNPIGFFSVVALPCFLVVSLILSDCMKKIRIELKKVDEIEESKNVIFTKEEYEELKLKILQELLEEMKTSAIESEENIAEKEE